MTTPLSKLWALKRTTIELNEAPQIYYSSSRDRDASPSAGQFNRLPRRDAIACEGPARHHQALRPAEESLVFDLCSGSTQTGFSILVSNPGAVDV